MTTFWILGYAFYLYLIATYLQRDNLFSVIGCFTLAFSIYFFLIPIVKKNSIRVIFYAAILFRFVTLFHLPTLSDDFYRFLWDGYLVFSGENPYLNTPQYWMNSNLLTNTPNELDLLYDKMNSREFFSVYPLVSQAFFVIPWISGFQTIEAQSLILKLILFTFEIGNLFLLKQNHPKSINYWLYAGNPLLILESVTEIHLESILTFFMLLLLSRGVQIRKFIFYLFFVILIHIKINLIFLAPAFFKRLNKIHKFSFVLISLLCIFSIFLTVFYNLGDQTRSGIGLFFHSFRFHSLMEMPIYLILFLIPKFQYLSGFISLILGGILYLYLLRIKTIDDNGSVFLGLLILYLFSPVVHPWYILPVFALSIRSSSFEVMITVLSVFAAFSYIFYFNNSMIIQILFSLVESMFVVGYVWIKKPSLFSQKTQS
ncbi:MAG: hypothetical protein SH817_14585 [Leptospira sp.]|nr:hypothetical protein [Leptospira sp.]